MIIMIIMIIMERKEGWEGRVLFGWGAEEFIDRLFRRYR